MYPTQAAEVIGCHADHVRHLIRTGQLKAKKVPIGPCGAYAYEIPQSEVRRVLKEGPKGGWPRGKRRTKTRT